MRLLVECTEDPASVNIADRLRERVDWSKKGLFAGERVLAHGDWRMVTIDEMHLHRENLHQQLPPSLADPDLVVFLSRHKSESGTPTMSVHPIGNFADASYGGQRGTVVEPHPAWMAGLFDELRARDPDGFEVTYEATHHGPYLEAPTLFYELGSTEDEWTDGQAGDVLAGALLEASPSSGRSVMWVGGGHYCPQVNDAVRETEIVPGHVLPGWATGKGIEKATLEQAVDVIPDCEGYVLQPEATSDERQVARRLDALGVERLEL
jgi:D-aminoacyl-tRNA deacylase